MNTEATPNYQQLIDTAYTAFNARDINTLLDMMHPEVKWSRAWEGDYAIGHDEVRAYWTRQWQEIDPTVTPLAINERPDGTIEVEVDQLVKDLEGKVMIHVKVKHIYVIENGLLKQMNIEQY